MKKVILSVIVLSTFVFYIFFQKAGSDDDEGVVKSPASASPQAQNSSKPQSSKFKDGTFQGDLVDAYYGNVQVEAIIKNGRISDVRFLDYPSDRRTSERINGQAMPYLIQEAIQAQDYQVDIISGATQTSKAFIESLKSALVKAS